MAGQTRILVICDNEEISVHLRQELIINGGYFVSFEAGAQSAIASLRENNYDLVIAKYGVFDLDGSSLVNSLKKADPNCVIVAIVAGSDSELPEGLLSTGVYDFVTRPFNSEKLLFVVKKGIELHSLLISSQRTMQGMKERSVSLEKQNILLTKRIEESTRNLSRLYEDLRSTYMRTIKVLAQAIDARDHYTHSHSENVAKYAVAIAEEFKLSAKEIETIREACELHDLGKIGIEDSILSKPSSLTEEEWTQIKRHPVIGAQILEPLTFLTSVVDMVRQHHERYDGKGYPEGRKGEDILFGARIINLADAYEAMSSARSYRKQPFSKEEAILEINKCKGAQFDPKVVDAFLKIVDNL